MKPKKGLINIDYQIRYQKAPKVIFWVVFLAAILGYVIGTWFPATPHGGG
jgi:uncharacterized membrane protein